MLFSCKEFRPGLVAIRYRAGDGTFDYLEAKKFQAARISPVSGSFGANCWH